MPTSRLKMGNQFVASTKFTFMNLNIHTQLFFHVSVITG
jgi:hypothetical protein